MNTIQLIRSDLQRLNSKTSVGFMLKRLVTNASFKVTFWFRIGTYLKTSQNILKFLYPIAFVMLIRVQYKTGIVGGIPAKVLNMEGV
ncbi:hypothetical protein [Saccharicrinis sp. 156]|uniref:hypothetical protein n=1 Tax=Saccharicrinis sp. 156 TaxID=3417574 RepID=UPI003D34F883